MRNTLMLRAALAFSLLISAGVYAQSPAQNNNEDVFFRNIPGAERYAVIITGAAASEEIGDRFWQWSLSLHDVLARDYGYSEDTITLLIDDGGAGRMSGSRIDGSSRREDIESAFTALSGRTRPGDQVAVFLIGHGSGAELDAKFNIVGPDITGVEFAALLDQFNQQDIIVINTTSASYEFSAALSGRGRVIVSATRSQAERYDPMFARYLIEALDGRAGDRDKNNRVSVLEVFTYAGTSVLGWYRDQGRLPTERAVLDDNGDGIFSIDPAPGGGDGGLAEIAYLDAPSVGAQKTSSEARQLMAEMQDLERSVFLLRGQKTNYLEDDYWNRMETLLIELARKTGRYNELP
ncbi:MAG: hypothetical protein Q8L60_07900 [Gammaproteobacteria bacterium]|nr:hypothetical protein [Gammaproteobacteria bacterium]MDP2140815.1 hypothetical protein [Gammaproteobacteria bacterium]MDP2347561.1 hypothetical protein [Gammaproteobacteria bacterium]